VYRISQVNHYHRHDRCQLAIAIIITMPLYNAFTDDAFADDAFADDAFIYDATFFYDRFCLQFPSLHDCSVSDTFFESTIPSYTIPLPTMPLYTIAFEYLLSFDLPSATTFEYIHIPFAFAFRRLYIRSNTIPLFDIRYVQDSKRLFELWEYIFGRPMS